MLMTNNDGDDEDRNEPRELGGGPKEWEWKWVHRSARFLGTRRSVACLLNETNPFHSEFPSSQFPVQFPSPIAQSQSQSHVKSHLSIGQPPQWK